MGAMKIIEKNNERVLTTAQLAEVYGTDYKSISKNFNRNKQRYQEGKHYFLLQGEERQEFMLDYRQNDDSLKHAKHIFLWTAKGALLHAKSLGTDEAWNAYEQLVDDYFNKVEQLQRMNVPTQLPTTIEDILITALTNMKEMKFENQELKKAVNQLALVVDNEVILTKHQKSEIQQAVNRRQGELNREGYASAHFQGIYTTLKTHFNVPGYAEIKRSDFDKAMKIISGWYPKKAEE
ncbi:ORF6N domain-containing protein [Paenibacillus oryzisoli]|uniref:Antirepressor n=1 Tax=Paenibacillus oryzisoli TaxID=1850517 RepID=A0A198ADX4_9BACL|nr:ORF6N domain-containing protein [Paenibacillus oryzisoli]OAS19285.1 hypothetical protein A8708_26610 [Paenibacillus oryzisoli]